jgi:DNA-binding HxlR family transcriptional regulator
MEGRMRQPRIKPPSEASLERRLERGDVFSVGCPSREVMRHVTSSWGVLALIALQAGTHRFSDLRRKISGVSERMLAQTLTALAHEGLVERNALPVVPPHVEYTLTPLGRQAARRVATLANWIEDNLGPILAARGASERAQRQAAARLPASATPLGRGRIHRV